jgi:hypothetical protein
LLVASASAPANNILPNMWADPPSYNAGSLYTPGEFVLVGVFLKDETTDVNSLELTQVDLKITNATLVPFAPIDQTNPITDLIVFGGLGGDWCPDSQCAPDTPNWISGPTLPGCPANCLIGSVPSASGGGTIYFWLRTSTATSGLLNPPASGSMSPGRLFIQFRVILDGPPGSTATIDALGPGLDDGSSSGAFSQQAGTGQQWANGDASIDPNDEFNYVGGLLTLTTVPEPGAIGLLGVGLLMLILARRR